MLRVAALLFLACCSCLPPRHGVESHVTADDLEVFAATQRHARRDGTVASVAPATADSAFIELIREPLQKLATRRGLPPELVGTWFARNRTPVRIGGTDDLTSPRDERAVLILTMPSYAEANNNALVVYVMSCGQLCGSAHAVLVAGEGANRDVLWDDVLLIF